MASKKNKTMNFSISITKEDKWYVARCPELGVTSQGKTFEDARANVEEAMELYFESFGYNDLPEAKETPIWTMIQLPVHA